MSLIGVAAKDKQWVLPEGIVYLLDCPLQVHSTAQFTCHRIAACCCVALCGSKLEYGRSDSYDSSCFQDCHAGFWRPPHRLHEASPARARREAWASGATVREVATGAGSSSSRGWALSGTASSMPVAQSRDSRSQGSWRLTWRWWSAMLKSGMSASPTGHGMTTAGASFRRWRPAWPE